MAWVEEPRDDLDDQGVVADVLDGRAAEDPGARSFSSTASKASTGDEARDDPVHLLSMASGSTTGEPSMGRRASRWSRRAGR